MNKKFVLIVLLSLFSQLGIGQITNLKELPDSIRSQVDTIDINESKSNFLMYKTWEFIPDNLDLAYLIIKHSEKIARENGYLKGIANAKTTLGAIFQLQSDFPRALEYQFDALEIYKNNDDPDFKSSLGAAYNNIGNTYLLAENIDEALKYYNLAYERRSKDKDTVGAMNTLSNMVAIHLKNEDFEKTLKKSYSIIDSMNFYNQESGREIFGDEKYSNIYSNMIESYKNLDYPDSTLMILEKVLNHIDTTKNYARFVKIYIDAAISYKKLHHHDKAEHYLSKALNDISKSNINYSLKDKSDISNKLYEYFKNIKEYKKALTYYEEYFNYNKEELNKEKNEKIATFNNQIRFKEKENELKLLATENELKSEQIIAANNVRNILILLAVIILAFSFILFRKFKLTKKLNEKISEKNNEILDSIIYAERIQKAILPPLKLLKEQFSDIFVLYQPKDVVAGDFYWFHKNHNQIFLAAADCTGHGVPGAMVSVVANSALNRSVKEFQLIDTNRILDKSREIVIEEFEKSEEDVKDGMDISFISISNNELSFSGANSPLWIVKNGILERNELALNDDDKIFHDQSKNNTLIELKPDKQPIGKYDNAKPFSKKTIKLDENDSIYLFSDGYADQFGGRNNKKLKRSKLREIILKNNHLPMDEQKNILHKTLIDWMGKSEQVDDVCVIGVRL